MERTAAARSSPTRMCFSSHAWRYKSTQRLRNLSSTCKKVKNQGEVQQCLQAQQKFADKAESLLEYMSRYLQLSQELRAVTREMAKCAREMQSEDSVMTTLADEFDKHSDNTNILIDEMRSLNQPNLLLASYIQELKKKLSDIDKPKTDTQTHRSARSVSKNSPDKRADEKSKSEEIEATILYHHCRDLMDEALLDVIQIAKDYFQFSTDRLTELHRFIPDSFETYQREDSLSRMSFLDLTKNPKGQKIFERYLLSIGSNELLLFCDAVEDMKKSVYRDASPKQAEDIYRNFMKEPLRCRLHFPAELLAVLDDKFHFGEQSLSESETMIHLGGVTPEVFDTSYKIAWNHLSKYSFSRFIKSGIISDLALTPRSNPTSRTTTPPPNEEQTRRSSSKTSSPTRTVRSITEKHTISPMRGMSFANQLQRAGRSVSLSGTEKEEFSTPPNTQTLRMNGNDSSPRVRIHSGFLFRASLSPHQARYSPSLETIAASPVSKSLSIGKESPMSGSLEHDFGSIEREFEVMKSPGAQEWDERQELMKTPFETLHRIIFRPSSNNTERGTARRGSTYCRVLDDTENNEPDSIPPRKEDESFDELLSVLTPRKKSIPGISVHQVLTRKPDESGWMRGAVSPDESSGLSLSVKSESTESGSWKINESCISSVSNE